MSLKGVLLLQVRKWQIILSVGIAFSTEIHKLAYSSSVLGFADILTN